MLTTRPVANGTHDEHRELLALIDTLRRRLSGPAWADPMVGSLLDSLGRHLESHFQDEEVDGLFDELMEMAPHVAPRIEGLLAEHHRMLIAADDLRHRFGRVRHTRLHWQQLGDSFERLREMLMMHECQERHLLQEVFTQDEGSKD